jgi:hypothetical protein
VNRLVLRYGYPLSAAILLVFAWVVTQRLARGIDAIIPLALAALIVWPIGTIAFVVSWPRITVAGFRRAIVRNGFGGGPIGINTLYAAPDRPSQAESSDSLLAVGTDDLLYLGGWLDVNAGPRCLHVPEMDGRYYSLQFTDPVDGANFAYVGTRTTGTGAGDFLLCAPSWNGRLPAGTIRIDVPHRAALVIGRVFAADDDDRRVAHALASQIQLTPLDAGS